MAKTKRARRPKSAISRVVGSGLDLVPRKKSHGKPITISGIAKIDFKPWKRGPDMREDELVPSNEFLIGLGMPCRMAYGIMLRSREQLIASHGKLDHQHVDLMMSNLKDTAERLKEIVYMVEAAYLRVLASAAAAYKQGVKFKGVDNRPARKSKKA